MKRCVWLSCKAGGWTAAMNLWRVVLLMAFFVSFNFFNCASLWYSWDVLLSFQLRAKTDEFRFRIQNGASVDSIQAGLSSRLLGAVISVRVNCLCSPLILKRESIGWQNCHRRMKAKQNGIANECFNGSQRFEDEWMNLILKAINPKGAGDREYCVVKSGTIVRKLKFAEQDDRVSHRSSRPDFVSKSSIAADQFSPWIRNTFWSC